MEEDSQLRLSIGDTAYKFPKLDPAETKARIVTLFKSEMAVDYIQVSLRCPLSKKRMVIPCRPYLCNHLQCFDLATYVMMNQQSGKSGTDRQGRTVCPVCGEKVFFGDIDVYFLDVLNDPRTQSEEAIQVVKDGSWRLVEKSTVEADKTVEVLSSSDDESGSEEEASDSSQSKAILTIERKRGQTSHQKGAEKTELESTTARRKKGGTEERNEKTLRNGKCYG